MNNSPYLDRPLRIEEQAYAEIHRRDKVERLWEAELNVVEWRRVLDEEDAKAHRGENVPFYFTDCRIHLVQSLGAWKAARDRLRKELGYD